MWLSVGRSRGEAKGKGGGGGEGSSYLPSYQSPVVDSASVACWTLLHVRVMSIDEHLCNV